jgi:cytochrome d ubiquinol oxidase subunit II
MFAAFPGWYATMFSGMYLAIVLLLLALIGRGVAFEYREKVRGRHWRRFWDAALTWGSLLAPLLIGIALGGLLGGLPIDSAQEYTGTFWDLLQPYALFVGVTLVLLCALHGATFMALKTSGELNQRAARLARLIAPAAGVAVLVFAGWTHSVAGKGLLPNIVEVAAVMAVFGAAWLVREGREGWAFAATTFAIATCVLAIFTELFPRLMVSSTDSAYDLTIATSASGPYALRLMTIIFALFFPLVVAYQSWTYYVFRRRLRRDDFHQPA